MIGNLALLLRFVLGGLFLFSGLEKAVSPSENFLYVIQNYDVLPKSLEVVASLVFPWAEIILAAFILSGLWLKISLQLLGLMSASLILMVGQAIIRNLPLDSCGCFGNLIHVPLRGVLMIDLSVLLSVIVCVKNIDKASRFSLDAALARA